MLSSTGYYTIEESNPTSELDFVFDNIDGVDEKAAHTRDFSRECAAKKA